MSMRVLVTDPAVRAVLRAPALRGYGEGRPDRETNDDLSLARKLGVDSEAGLYEVVAQQWYRVTKWLREGREHLATVAVELEPCGDGEGGESEEETRWNDAVRDMLLGGRVGVEGVVPGQVNWGWASWVALAYEAYWYGFSLAVPRWVEAPGDPARGRIVAEVMLRSAVNRWETEPNAGHPKRVWYATSRGMQWLDYARCVHLVVAGLPGQLYGDAALRPLIGPGLRWVQSLVQSGMAEVAEAGRLRIKSASAESEADRYRYEEIGGQFGDGRLAWTLERPDEDMSTEFPRSSSGDRTQMMRYLDEIADMYFSQTNASLYSSGSGSRAAAEVVGSETSGSREVTSDVLVDVAYRGMARWVAEQTGYTGRIRRAFTVQPASKEPATTIVQALASARAAGLMDWTEADQVALRELLGWGALPERSATKLPAPAATALEVRSLDDSLSMSAIRLTDTPSRTVRGRDGEYVTWCEEEGVELDGATYQVFGSMAWLAEDAAAEAALATLESWLAPLVQRHGEEVEAALARGAGPEEMLRLQTWWTSEYGTMIAEAIRAERARVAADTYKVAETQTGVAPRDGTETELAAEVAPVVEALDVLALRGFRSAAAAMAQRVQGEVSRRGADGSRLTLRGLAREAQGAMRLAGEAQRVETAPRVAPEGHGVIGFVRLAVLDHRLCKRCREHHLRRWSLRTEKEEFVAYVEKHGPPDPTCAGGVDRCRCTLVPIYGRVASNVPSKR